MRNHNSSTSKLYDSQPNTVNHQLNNDSSTENTSANDEGCYSSYQTSGIKKSSASNDAHYLDTAQEVSMSSTYVDNTYKKAKDSQANSTNDHTVLDYSKHNTGNDTSYTFKDDRLNTDINPKNDANRTLNTINISERLFMNSLLKHTAIALAIIVPLAAYSAYAATPIVPINQISNNMSQNVLEVNPSQILYNTASTPTTVDSVDLEQYAGDWYEIARLPLFFQRNCASDVMANYTPREGDSGIVVTNKCAKENGEVMVTEGLATLVDSTGSKLEVTFLPSWIRWLPVGRGDYWVLARDPEYKTALVGTPDKDNLWLLARSPNISQQTYDKYRQIAQSQGYDLNEFNLTPHQGQTVSLMP